MDANSSTPIGARVVLASTQPQASTSSRAAYTTGRSLDQQVDASPNNSNYSNLTNSTSTSSNNSSACSPLAAASASSTSSSSAPQYSEDIRRTSTAARHHSNGSASTKTCEADIGDAERDTFSPVSSPECNGAAALEAPGNSSSHSGALDNKNYEGIKVKPPSKEEKQRQNEEIVCMETSTVSTETGSWESVYPTSTNMNVQRSLDKIEQPSTSYQLNESEPFERQRTSSTGAGADTSSLFKGISANSLLREFEKREQPLSTSGTSACFIDASSLRDEDEVLSFPSLDGQAQDVEMNAPPAGESTELDTLEESPTKQLEEFHKAFAKCKSGAKMESSPPPQHLPYSRTNSSSSSHSGAESPQKEQLESTNNLSDEEKLWKREQQLPASKDAKDTDVTEASVSLAADADSSDSSLSVKMRREMEERPRPVPYSFQHNAHNFSVHPLGTSPKFAPHHGHTPHSMPHGQAHSDLSYTTDYSSSSPAPSLVWSEHEPRTGGLLRQPQLAAAHAPDTPHNSIVHIEHVSNSSNNSSIHRDYTLSSSLSHHRDSGAYCSDATDSPVPLPRTPKRTSKCDEANPIVSGGASIEDFRLKQCESPSIKRRNDTCPIVSGGFSSLDFAHTRPLHDEDDDEDDEAEVEGVELRVKSKARKPVPGIASWVVDMSDCRSERRKSTSSTSSVEAATRFRERSDSNSSHKSGCGFYVSLDDMDRKPVDAQPLSKSYTAPKSAGFFVNLSQSDLQTKDTTHKSPEQTEESATTAADKKNIFSMFIDFGSDKKPRPSARKEPFNLAQRLSSSLTTAQRRSEDAMKSSASSTETLMAKSATQRAQVEEEMAGESKSLDYKCNLDPPLTVAALRRLSQQQRQQNDPTKRHSWGNNNINSTNGEPPIGDYKRSISLTANGDTGKDQGAGLMSIIDKLPIISKASSLSVDSSLSPYDEYTGSKSGLSSCSNASARNSMSGGEREDGEQADNGTRIKKRRRDVQINETFDKSSVASITEGVLSKDRSPASTTDTDDLTFQQDEELALREAALQPLQLSSSSNRTSTIIMETIIETKETSSPKKSALNNGHTMETLHATIEKQKQLLETVNEHAEAQTGASKPENFVKLSDMDKPVKHELNSPDAMSKSVGNHRSSQLNRLYRDDASKTRPHSWAMTRSTGGSNIQTFASSVDNLRSLSRLFPNFSKEFSNSLPNDMALDQQQHQLDYIQTDLSADSSLASSFSRSAMDESSISCRQPRRLGEDLLKMFLQEIATDMVVEVHGRRIRAHKCILRSRCQYFAAMLAGHGAQSVVSLQGYSYSAVHFALCHIYSGASHPPDGISLMELAALADLLGLEGLKEVTSHALKTNYCHNFHKPCSGCIDGILQVLPVALNHALDDLYRKCLRWTCRHYLKVWPTRQFSQLPPDILGRCRQQIVAYLTSETVLDTVLDCDHLLSQLSAYRWGHVCEQLVRDILDAAYAYVGDHFASLIASDAFLSLGHDRSRHIPRLEGVLLHTASSLTPDQACRSYQRVTRLNTVLQAKIIQMPVNLGELAKELQGLQEEELDWEPDYIRLVSALLSAVEQCLIRQCSRAMRVTAWQRMDLDLRKKIQTLARLTEPLDLKRNSKPIGKAFSFGGNTRSQDLVQIKLAIQAQSKRAHAQETQLYKATQTLEAGNVQTAERGVQANHEPRETSGKLLKSNSRAYVPQTQRSSSQVAPERHSLQLNMHRRTQSEAPPVAHKKAAGAMTESEPKAAPAVAKSQARLSEVRPRYLEPRKPRAVSANNSSNKSTGPIRSATSSSIPTGHNKPAKGLHISSSDSSRHSSPAAARRVKNGIGNKSTNLSMDSLASPARRAKSAPRTCKPADHEQRYASDLNVDSLTESMKSSVITNKTISHESLTGSSKLARVQQLNNRNKEATTAATAPKVKVGNKSTRQLKQQHNTVSNGSSPSSVHTTKSATSRLSSVSSTLSTRDLFKQRSISVPAGDAVPPKGRHSFLSAKSREILAKRAEKNKLQQQQQQQQQQAAANSSGDERGSRQRASTGPLRSSSHSAVTNMLQQHNLRNSLPSNIPTRRPNTLQLKKATTTAMTTTTNGLSHRPQQSAKMASTNGVNGVYKTAHAVKQKLDLLIDATLDEPMQRVESKLERSSTFCKESADVDVSELQIVE
ncbi:uncharacterized protein LOC115628396 [Scaptodrosophila lebanonensis]|uniref:Uncharacterized protein LOC115628396 n=1 Tax=Drosophila lebanonensis TaxID=7225 RepID=A0A6J2TXP3_DROLE|nr:uncharacterized protein LOC115628396 [Scaptodrosophila lebanonensis]XP_030380345.1 uncharacterized protein LOC115628396 [Scaptodrosophila lebanonensis]